MIENHKVFYKGVSYLVRILPDIAVRGGLKGCGTVVSIYTAAGLKGYQGAYSVAKVKRILKANLFCKAV